MIEMSCGGTTLYVRCPEGLKMGKIAVHCKPYLLTVEMISRTWVIVISRAVVIS